MWTGLVQSITLYLTCSYTVPSLLCHIAEIWTWWKKYCQVVCVCVYVFLLLCMTIGCWTWSPHIVYCCSFSCSFCRHAASMYLVISEFALGWCKRGSSRGWSIWKRIVYAIFNSRPIQRWLTKGLVSQPISCASVWGKSYFFCGVSWALLYTLRNSSKFRNVQIMLIIRNM